MKLSRGESKTLREHLPKGHADKLAKKCKVTARWVRYILKGDHADKHGVIEAAIEMRDKELLKIKELKSKI